MNYLTQFLELYERGMIPCVRKQNSLKVTHLSVSLDSNPGHLGLAPELTLPGTGLTASLPGASPRVCPSWRLDQRGGRISFLVCLGLPFTPELFCKDSDPELQQNMPSITVKDRHLCEKRTGGGGD